MRERARIGEGAGEYWAREPMDTYLSSFFINMSWMASPFFLTLYYIPHINTVTLKYT
jgi:hypothetical protein